MFLERSDHLRAAFLGDVKVILMESGNRLSFFVCDNHVHHDDATFDFDGRALNKCGNRRPLLAGLRGTQRMEKEERGGRENGANHANLPKPLTMTLECMQSTSDKRP